MADDRSELENEPVCDATTSPVSWTRTGVMLLVLSGLLWLPLPIVPFLPVGVGTKAAVGGGLLLAAEIAFWLGTALAGPEAVRRVRGWTRAAFGRRG